jgi:hypothetical protein
MRYLKHLSAAFFAVLLAACGTTGSVMEKPEQYLAKRAEARWNSMIAGDWEKAYGYFTPGYREVNEYEAFRLGMVNRQVNWSAARGKAVECESEEKCLVKIDIDYSLVGGMRGVPEVAATRNQTETWLNLGGEWYFLPDKAVQ